MWLIDIIVMHLIVPLSIRPISSPDAVNWQDVSLLCIFFFKYNYYILILLSFYWFLNCCTLFFAYSSLNKSFTARESQKTKARSVLEENVKNRSLKMQLIHTLVNGSEWNLRDKHTYAHPESFVHAMLNAILI